MLTAGPSDLLPVALLRNVNRMLIIGGSVRLPQLCTTS